MATGAAGGRAGAAGADPFPKRAARRCTVAGPRLDVWTILDETVRERGSFADVACTAFGLVLGLGPLIGLWEHDVCLLRARVGRREVRSLGTRT